MRSISIYYFLPNVIANAQSGQDELTICCWSKASGKSWLCCSNTGFAIYLFSFLPSYEWASKQDPIDLSVKQSLIRGQYHHYHHHQSKSCLPWPSTITHRVASFTQLKKCWRKKEKKKMTSMIQGKCHVSDLQSWTNQCLGYFILANHSKNIHWCMILFCTFSL